MADYYRQLGIYATATDVQVQRAVRRYWQRVARFRPAQEQQPFLAAATVLSNPHLRAVYDPAYTPDADSLRLEASNLRHLSSKLRTDLHQEQTRSYRLEHEVRSLRSALTHALDYPQEMAEKRAERRRLWSRMALLLLLPLAYGLLRTTGSGGGVADIAGPPYQPVAEGTTWLITQRDSLGVYKSAESMPQYPGGADGLRGFLRQQVYSSTSMATADQVCATGQLCFVVDSTGQVQHPAQILGVPATNATGQQLLQRAAAQLPRLVPGYVRARPVAVRLTVPLAK